MCAERYYNAARGGGQGDYSHDIQGKIDNVVECLATKPFSKRAVLSVMYTTKYSSEVKYDDTNEAKCLRELYFHCTSDADNEVTLFCTGVMRGLYKLLCDARCMALLTLLGIHSASSDNISEKYSLYWCRDGYGCTETVYSQWQEGQCRLLHTSRHTSGARPILVINIFDQHFTTNFSSAVWQTSLFD